MTEAKVPFTQVYLTGRERAFIDEAITNRELSGDGAFARRCQEWIEAETGTFGAILTHSCTAALEMAALLLEIAPGDEVIMPSFTFASTANAFALRGGVPVFVDIREDTANLDENLIEAAITSRTRAIVPVHYAGVACEMDAIEVIARRHGLAIVEDAAQAIGSTWRGRKLGSLGDLGALSFHESKNVVSGEGGCLLVNRPELLQSAEIIRDKGTDRSRFRRGQTDHYTWQSLGSSYLPSELIAAFLLPQLLEADAIRSLRLSRWSIYHDALVPLEAAGWLRRPIVPDGCGHNGHIYFVLMNSRSQRDHALAALNRAGIAATFHYVPLHSSPAGRLYGRTSGTLPVTDDIADRLMRFPMSTELTDEQQSRIVALLEQIFREQS